MHHGLHSVRTRALQNDGVIDVAQHDDHLRV
jgi:hypothetical protein